MSIISNTTVISNFASIERLELLHVLFDKLYITSEVFDEIQDAPILNWFEQRQIKVDINPKAIDTTGFFDEVALTLGNQYDLLKEISEQIKYK